MRQRDQIAAEFAALEECFNKTVALHAQESVRIAQHSSGSSASALTTHSPLHPLDLGSGPGFPVWDEDRVRSLERNNATSFSTLREVRAERDSWRNRAERAERESTTTKGTMRELRAHCAYLESQLQPSNLKPAPAPAEPKHGANPSTDLSIDL